MNKPIEIKGEKLWVHPCGLTTWSEERPPPRYPVDPSKSCIMKCPPGSVWSMAYEPPGPADRSLVDVLNAVKVHHNDNPTHGTNCACMDQFVRQVRAMVREANPQHRAYANGTRSEHEADLDIRIDHVLTSAARWW